MWVVLAHNFANYTSTLIECAIWAVTTVIHCVDNTSVYWLEAVSHIWQCARDDNAHRVVKVRPLHFNIKVNDFNLIVGCVINFSH